MIVIIHFNSIVTTSSYVAVARSFEDLLYLGAFNANFHVTCASFGEIVLSRL